MIDVVIGSNFGDESKGTVVANIAKNYKGNIVNVLSNGGAQRAHSIILNGKNFTFQHFGSASPFGAVSYFPKNFVLNPMQYVKEAKELRNTVSLPNAIRHKNCKWTTPYDILANQSLTNGSFTSCGMGVWNTIKRNDKLTLTDFVNLPEDRQIAYLKNIRDVYYGNIEISPELRDFWLDENIMRHFIADCVEMKFTTIEVVDESFFDSYSNIIFENGQGLLLNDPGYDKKGSTPSKTGLDEVVKILPKNAANVNVHYVTRPYITRHGADIEFAAKLRTKLSSGIEEDRTNHFNQFQGEFKYDWLNIERLKERVEADFTKITKANMILEVTHCDELDRSSEFKKLFNTINFTDRAEIF